MRSARLFVGSTNGADRKRFRLLLALRGGPRQDRNLRISATTNDIARPPLVQAMLDDIVFVRQKLERFARGLDVLFPSAEAFLESSRQTASAVLLRGALLAEPVLVAVRLLFRLTDRDDAPSAEFLHDHEFNLVKVPVNEIASTTLDRDTAAWFLGVFAHLRNWQDLFT